MFYVCVICVGTCTVHKWRNLQTPKFLVFDVAEVTGPDTFLHIAHYVLKTQPCQFDSIICLGTTSLKAQVAKKGFSKTGIFLNYITFKDMVK